MMDLIILGFILVCAFLIPFKLINKLSSSSLVTTTTLPPGPPGWPVIGNLFELGSLPHRDMARLCDRYGPLVYLRLGSIDAITTNDPEIIAELLVKQDEVFNSRPRNTGAVHLAHGCEGVAFAPMGPKWKRMRRICMEHLLTTRRLESFTKQRADEVHRLVHDVWLVSKRGEDVNLKDMLYSFAMNIMTGMLMGKRYFGVGSIANEEAKEFRKVMPKLFTLLGLIYMGDYLPFWRWFDPMGYEGKMREAAAGMDVFFTKIIEGHREKSKENKGDQFDGKMDFVDVLLSLPSEDGKELEDEDIKALIQDMLAAATDTSAVTSEWTMAEVIKHPSILKKVQEELDTVVGHDRMVSEIDLPHLTYLRCVVRETFRMHPAAPFLLPHEAIRATTVKGYFIPAKTRVFINQYALGRNTKIWNDIGEFRPERHFPENIGSRVEMSHGADFNIIPFSAGKRKCPGAPLGVTLALMAVARLFHSFDWTPPHGMKPDEIDTQEVYALVMPKATALVAVAKPRLPIHLYQL